jgi:ABC-type bacteriocin/lantibiotic exporter with double-glycine peptidase domain
MYEEASQVATDAVGSIRTVASFCAEKRVMTKYNQKCQASKSQGIRTGIVGGLGFGFSYMMLYATSALCYYVGAKFISQGNSNFGSVFKVTTRNPNIIHKYYNMIFVSYYYHAGLLCSSFGHDWSITN